MTFGNLIYSATSLILSVLSLINYGKMTMDDASTRTSTDTLCTFSPLVHICVSVCRRKMRTTLVWISHVICTPLEARLVIFKAKWADKHISTVSWRIPTTTGHVGSFTHNCSLSSWSTFYFVWHILSRSAPIIFKTSDLDTYEDNHVDALMQAKRCTLL